MIRAIIKYLLIVSFVFLSNIGFMNHSFAAEENKRFDLQTSPQRIFFNVSNLKPGDIIIRNISVSNEGEMKFTYTSYADFRTGSRMFYEQMNLQVIHEDKMIFDGKLSEFTGFDPKVLDINEEDDFTFNVEFPYDSGNEFQGLSLEFNIVFTAEGNESTVNPPVTTPTNGGLPQTGESNPIWYYLSGIMLAGVGVGILRQSLKGDRPRLKG